MPDIIKSIIKIIIWFIVGMALLIATIFISTYSMSLGFTFLALIVVSGFAIAIIRTNKKYKKKIRKTSFNDEFKNMYDYLESRYSKELEHVRKTLRRIICISVVLFTISCIIFGIIVIRLDVRSESGQEIIFAITFLPSFAYFTINYYKNIKTYKDKFKGSVIANFIQLINHNLQYSPSGNDRIKYYYQNAGFNDKKYNQFKCDDYISGYVDDEIGIELADVCLQTINRNNQVFDTSFIGMFSYSSFKNTIDKEIRIKKNRLNFSDKAREVMMDSQEFRKYFDVFCDSNILAMQILTHDVMEEIVNFYLVYKLEFEIVIIQNNIYIRFQTGSMFEPDIFKKSTNMNTLWIYYSILKFTISFTTKVNKLVKDVQT